MKVDPKLQTRIGSKVKQMYWIVPNFICSAIGIEEYRTLCPTVVYELHVQLFLLFLFH